MKILQNNEISFKEWNEKYSKYIENIIHNIHTFLKSLEYNDFVIDSYNQFEMDKILRQVIYTSSSNRFKTYKFLK